MSKASCDSNPRLFFGAQVKSSWDCSTLSGRTVPEEGLHITLAFLGSCQPEAFALDLVRKCVIRGAFAQLPLSTESLSCVGVGNNLLFLPDHSPRAVAASVQWLTPEDPIGHYQKALACQLKEWGYLIDERPFLPHITMARSPFNKKEWLSQFVPFPFFVQAIKLYESIGQPNYTSLWEYPLIPPFEELDHTADLAFFIRGTTAQEIHRHAQVALAFSFPQLVPFFSKTLQDSVQEIVISLNQMISSADEQIGCPFKAVSFHGEFCHNRWEMIVDV